MTERYKVIEVKINDKQKEVLIQRAQIQDAIKNLKEEDFVLDLNLYPTTFAKSLKDKASKALYFIDDYHFENSVYYLRSRTRFILDQLEIPYRRLEND